MITGRIAASGNDAAACAYVLACHYAGGSDLVLPLGAQAQACRQTRAAFTCQAR